MKTEMFNIACKSFYGAKVGVTSATMTNSLAMYSILLVSISKMSEGRRVKFHKRSSPCL